MKGAVLLVEDEPDIRMLTRYILEPAGYELVEATSGEEAIAIVQEQPLTLVLLDIRLPAMSGWEVLRWLKSGRFHEVPVVMMSAHSSGHTQRRAQEEGSNGYLVKPFEAEVLLDCIERFVGDGP